MMNERKTPWDAIKVPDRDFNVRLAADAAEVPVYWGRDAGGHCLLIVDLKGDHSDRFHREAPLAHGLNIDLRQADIPDCQHLVLTLEQEVDRDLFFGLCEALLGSLLPVTDSAVALDVSFSHIKRWKAFLAGKQGGILSIEQIKGLFAELHFLRGLYLRYKLTQLQAVEAWYGPDGGHQDFIFNDTAVEIKSLSGKNRNSVQISSENQLESIQEKLFLVIYHLSEHKEHKEHQEPLSLNELVKLIWSELTDAESIERFGEKLTAAGYMPLHEYDQPGLIISTEQAYRVDRGFPRLTRSTLPAGIMYVSYEIALENLRDFSCGTDEITREMENHGTEY